MLLIFDWDGTLSDSTNLIVSAMQAAARSAGVDVRSHDEVCEIIGLGLPEAISTLYPYFSEVDFQLFRRYYADHFIEMDEASPAELFPGVMETLEQLKDMNHQLVIATGKSRKGLDRILTKMGLAGFFDDSRCADETLSKPNPLMLNELLQVFRCSSGEAVMVGDTEFDMAMARAISMPRIAVTYGAHHVSRLEQYQPEVVLDQFSDLLRWPRLSLA